MQNTKGMFSAGTSSKSKKNSKDREKRKSVTGTIQNENSSSEKDKGSPSKECKEYAGVSSDSICIYAEQSTYENLSEDVWNTLTEDINYKLRYIIHDALIKARLLGRDAINAGDIDECFRTLRIDKVYGAPSTPNWVAFGEQNLLYVDDTKINLIEIAEEENVYVQEGHVTFVKTWLSDTDSADYRVKCEALKEYFYTVCQAIISNDPDLRQAALQDISENSSIGPVTEWFYHFTYFLLMKDITYDCLTLRALHLLEVLENSPLPSQNVSVKQLKLLVRLLLQRLLISVTTKDVLKPMCSVLATLCLREPLRELVIMKINQKIGAVGPEMTLSVLTVIYFLGVDAVKRIFLPNMEYFLTKVAHDNDPDLNYITMGIYGLICKADLNETYIHNFFYDTFGDSLIIFWRPLCFKSKETKQEEMDFINMKKQLIKMRRKVDCNIRRRSAKIFVEDVFVTPSHNCKVKQKLDEHRMQFVNFKKETHITVGKTSLLLSVLKSNKNNLQSKCCDHSLLAYNI